MGPSTEELRPVTAETLPARQWPWYRRPALIVPLAMLVVAAAVGVPLGIFHLGQSSSPKVSAGAPASPRPSTPSTSSAAPKPPSSFAEVFAQDSSGVVRLDTTSCNGSGVGTGFLVAPNLVATAAHVVNDASVIGVTAGSDTRVGTVIGIDETTDAALVRLNQALSGHVFGLQDAPPAVGSPVAAIGFPEGLPITFTQGSISGIGRTITLEGQARTGLIQTDVPLNPGNSGGPLLGSDGQVVGVVEAGAADANGISFAVSSTTAKPLYANWQANPQTVSTPSNCGTPTGPPADSSPHSDLTGADATAIGQTLLTYFRAIDSADYVTAWSQFTAEKRQSMTSDQFAAGLRTTYDFNIVLHSLTPQGPGLATVYATFTSLQSPQMGPNGEACDLWNIDYTMRNESGSWLIDQASYHNGQPPTPCG